MALYTIEDLVNRGLHPADLEEQARVLLASPDQWEGHAAQFYLPLLASFADFKDLLSQDAASRLSELSAKVPIPPEVVLVARAVANVKASVGPATAWDRFEANLPSSSDADKGKARELLDRLVERAIDDTLKYGFGSFNLPRAQTLILAYVNLFGTPTSTEFVTKMPLLVNKAFGSKEYKLAATLANASKVDLNQFNTATTNLREERDQAINLRSGEERINADRAVSKLESIALAFRAFYEVLGKKLTYTLEDEIRVVASRLTDPRFNQGTSTRIGLQYLSMLVINAKAVNVPAASLLQPAALTSLDRKIRDQRAYVAAADRFGAYTHNKIVSALQTVYSELFGRELPAPTPSEIGEMRRKIAG